MIDRVYTLLLQDMGYQGWWPVSGKYRPKDYSTPKNSKEQFEVCIGAILTQNTSWKNAEKAIASLRNQGLLSPEKIVSSSKTDLADAVKPAGYFNQKAKKLKKFSEFFNAMKGMPLRDELLDIWGIGRETADSILLYAYKKPFFVVDAYTIRIFSRMGLCRPDSGYEELRSIIEKSIKKDYRVYNEFHALLVRLGKGACFKNSPTCRDCCLNKACKKLIL